MLIRRELLWKRSSDNNDEHWTAIKDALLSLSAQWRHKVWLIVEPWMRIDEHEEWKDLLFEWGKRDLGTLANFGGSESISCNK